MVELGGLVGRSGWTLIVGCVSLCSVVGAFEAWIGGDVVDGGFGIDRFGENFERL